MKLELTDRLRDAIQISLAELEPMFLADDPLAIDAWHALNELMGRDARNDPDRTPHHLGSMKELNK